MATRKEGNVDSLLSITAKYVINNLSVYEKSCLDSLQVLPMNVKNRLLRKFTSTSYFSRNVTITNILKAFVNKQTTQINLTSVYVNDEMLDILCLCTNLKRLDLTRDGTKNCEITTKGLINLLNHTPNLENLIVMRCYQVNDNVLQCISENCPKLLGLDIGGSENVTDIGLVCLINMEIHWLRVSRTKITDFGITAFVKGKCGKTLVELMIDNCIHVTHWGLNEITRGCPNLTIFNFINCNTDVLATEFLEFRQPPRQLFWAIPF